MTGGTLGSRPAALIGGGVKGRDLLLALAASRNGSFLSIEVAITGSIPPLIAMGCASRDPFPSSAVERFYSAMFRGAGLSTRALLGIAWILPGVAGVMVIFRLPERFRRRPASCVLQAATIAV